MELIGFKIAATQTAIEYEGGELDLHNNYEFVGLAYSVATRTLELQWERSSGEWVGDAIPLALTLKFERVNVMRIREPDELEVVAEDKCLNVIGVMWNSARDDMDCYAASVPGEACTDILFSFMSGLSIKVGAATAELDIVTVPG